MVGAPVHVHMLHMPKSGPAPPTSILPNLALVSFLVKNTPFPTIVFLNPDRYMEITDSACVPTFSFPFVLDCHKYYKLMVAQGEGRSPMTSSDAETDSKPIIIIFSTCVSENTGVPRVATMCSLRKGQKSARQKPNLKVKCQFKITF